MAVVAAGAAVASAAAITTWTAQLLGWLRSNINNNCIKSRIGHNTYCNNTTLFKYNNSYKNLYNNNNTYNNEINNGP